MKGFEKEGLRGRKFDDLSICDYRLASLKSQIQKPQPSLALPCPVPPNPTLSRQAPPCHALKGIITILPKPNHTQPYLTLPHQTAPRPAKP